MREFHSISSSAVVMVNAKEVVGMLVTVEMTHYAVIWLTSIKDALALLLATCCKSSRRRTP